jgi:hypothetical protein
MDSTTAMSTPPEQVDNLIKMVADEHGLSVGETLQTPGMAAPQVQGAEKGE